MIAKGRGHPPQSNDIKLMAKKNLTIDEILNNDIPEGSSTISLRTVDQKRY